MADPVTALSLARCRARIAAMPEPKSQAHPDWDWATHPLGGHMVGSYEILFEVRPELRELPEAEVGALYRDFVNAPAQGDVRRWLCHPLSAGQRKKLQRRFKAWGKKP